MSGVGVAHETASWNKERLDWFNAFSEEKKERYIQWWLALDVKKRTNAWKPPMPVIELDLGPGAVRVTIERVDPHEHPMAVMKPWCPAASTATTADSKPSSPIA
jgi:hypothetical protein